MDGEAWAEHGGDPVAGAAASGCMVAVLSALEASEVPDAPAYAGHPAGESSAGDWEELMVEFLRSHVREFMGSPLAYPVAESERFARRATRRDVMREMAIVTLRPGGEEVWNRRNRLGLNRGIEFIRAAQQRGERFQLHAGPWEIGPADGVAGGRLLREFVLDYDVPDMDASEVTRRLCGCAQSGAKACCRHCWLYAEYAVAGLHYILVEILGFKDVRFFFSGNKGVHCWVSDPVACAMTNEMRKMTLDFICLLFSPSSSKIASNFMFSEMYRRFTAPWSRAIRSHGEAGASSREPASAPLGPHVAASLHRVREMRAIAPAFDRAVTVDLKHLVKLPWSLHSKTGARASEIIKIPSSPGDVPFPLLGM